MKKFFFFAIVTATVMIGLSACVEKLEPEVLPEVIESEVTGRGMDAITATSSDKDGVKTQELSYKSWIRVKGQTKADFDNTVEVKLINTLVDTDTTTVYSKDTTIVWGNLDPNGYVTRTSYRVRGTRQEGYVTITDSVLVYTIDYGGFSFDYELDYEVAVYDDGITQEVMPYHRIESIVDKGATSSRLETGDDGTFVYARKKLEHTITAECNGKTYEVKANVIISKIIGSASEPYVKRSEIVGSRTLYVSNEVIWSFIGVDRIWSDGREESVELKVELLSYIEDIPPMEKIVRGYAVPLRIVSSSLHDDKDATTVEQSDRDPYIYYEYTHQKWNIQYNYFDIDVGLFRIVPYYDDGYSCCEFPNYEFSDVINLEPVFVVSEEHFDGDGDYYRAGLVHQVVKAKYGELEYEKEACFSMATYE